MIVECPANTRLQEYLLKNDIHILTPCGGRGNCAKCKVKILKGEARVNTMDRIWFSQKELEEGLSGLSGFCQGSLDCGDI